MKPENSSTSTHCADNCSTTDRPKLRPTGSVWVIQEPCGLAHGSQTVAAGLPPDAADYPESFRLRDRVTGREFPGQRSRENRQTGFIGLALRPDERLELEFSSAPSPAPDHPVSLETAGDWLILDNGLAGIRIPVRQQPERGACTLSGPVGGIRHRGGGWFGETYFDTVDPLGGSTARIVESGALRAVVEFETGDRRYRARMTLDAGQRFVEFEETFSAFEGDQLVWIFEGGDLPETGCFLDQTPGFETRHLHYALDGELARLGAWSQQSQLNLADGYAFSRPGHDTLFGAVTFDGGGWRGNRLNSIDAVMRRLRGGDRRTRRTVHPFAKADLLTGPDSERIPARDRSSCTAALCLEGWIGEGRRHWGLALFAAGEFQPPGHGREVEPLTHFENRTTREICEAQQGALRKLHITRLFPLADQLCATYACAEPAGCRSFSASDAFFHEAVAPGEPDAETDTPEFLRRIEDYLDARVLSFWYGAGIISTNPVSSRRVGPYLIQLEALAAAGKVPAATLARLRARGLFLAALFHRQSYYAGASAMLAADDPCSLDPTMQGMMNQNFYTDVIALHGTAGLLYPGLPAAAAWRDTFIAMFSRQLDFHVYPESGVWEESHTYFQHVLFTVLPVLLMLRDAGQYDFFGDERLRKMLRCALDQVTPRDAQTGGRRHLTAFGDHGAATHPYHTMWGAFAAAVAPYDPELAGELNELAAETGGVPAPGVNRRPLAPHSKHLAGLGVFFRGADAGGGETLLALRSGKAWGHHHCDDSSIQLFAAGRQLLGDAGLGGLDSGMLKFTDDGHSRWTVPGRQILNYHWRFNRGWVTESGLDHALPFATCVTPAILERCREYDIALQRPLRHFRSVVKLNSNAFAVIDSNRDDTPSRYWFHPAAAQIEPDGENGVLADCAGTPLRIHALTGEIPAIGALTAGDRLSDRQTTRAVSFDAPEGRTHSVFVIRFGAAPAVAPVVRFEDGVITLSCDGGTVVLRHRE